MPQAHYTGWQAPCCSAIRIPRPRRARSTSMISFATLRTCSQRLHRLSGCSINSTAGSITFLSMKPKIPARRNGRSFQLSPKSSFQAQASATTSARSLRLAMKSNRFTHSKAQSRNNLRAWGNILLPLLKPPRFIGGGCRSIFPSAPCSRCSTPLIRSSAIPRKRRA